MNYYPEGIFVWDSWYFYHGGLAHCIHLQYPRPGSRRDERERGALGHAVSQDLITWTTQPTALYRGEPGAYDDCDLWTGCTLQHQGVLYLFYTARCSTENGIINRIALATSVDGVHWEKYPGNPILTPDSEWYCGEGTPAELHVHGWPIVDCRDLCVVPDPNGDGFWGFFAARRPGTTCAETSVIGLCHSHDLIHWKQHPPCFKPDKYACLEVPEVFYLDGKWYMLCLSGNVYGQRNRFSDSGLRTATIYAVADQVQGPYREPDNNVLIGSTSWQGFCAKTLELGGERYLFYTQGESTKDFSYGSVSIPKVLKTDRQGHLLPCYYHGLDRYLGKTCLEGATDVAENNHGQWGTPGEWSTSGDLITGNCKNDWAIQVYEGAGSNFMYTAEIRIGSARSAGLAFRIQGDQVQCGAYVLLIDADEGEILFTKTRDFQRLEARKWRVERDVIYHVRIMAIDAIFNVYIDDVLALQLFQSELSGGRFGLFVEQGTAFFNNVQAVDIIKDL